MKAKNGPRSLTQVKRLRRLSVQIAGQLPEVAADAIYVLEYAKRLIEIMDRPEMPTGKLHAVR